MKRSSQVALVLMGVTGATAAGAYMLPGNECRVPPPAAQSVAGATVTPPSANQPQTQPCRRSSGWHYGSWRSYSSSSERYRSSSTSRPPNSTSVGFTSSNSALRTGSGSTSTSTSRGGFGSFAGSIAHSIGS